ncbi:MAG TPA: SRPBCC family protein [Gemmatimonadales bacterium]|nr:SRPBCC family protein [Gemmatimonadales bacterium]
MSGRGAWLASPWPSGRVAPRPIVVGRLRAGAAVVATLSTLLALYLGVVRPWNRHWGTIDAELVRRMPGDEVVERPTYVTTRAVTIYAPPEAVWPWIAQMGELPRAGFYTSEWMGRLLGLRVRNASRVLLEHQEVDVGQALDRRGDLMVLAADPNHYLVLGSPPGAREAAATWSLTLYPTGTGATRLVSRVRARIESSLRRTLLVVVLDPAQFILERETLLGIKHRAERRPG